MWDIIDGIIIIPIMCAFTYGLIRQFEETISLAKSKEYRKMHFIGQVICCVSYTVFLLCYMINVLIAVFGKGNVFMNSQLTSILCTSSIAIFMISRYGIVSKN